MNDQKQEEETNEAERLEKDLLQVKKPKEGNVHACWLYRLQALNGTSSSSQIIYDLNWVHFQ